MGIFTRDITLALRRLVHAPAFTIVTSLSLAVGIGTNTAAFSVVYAVLLRELPVVDPASLAVVQMRHAATQYSMPHPAFLYLRDHSSTVRVVAFRNVPVNVSAGSRTERVSGMLVSGGYFDVLGVKPSIGTSIGEEDDRVPRSGGPRGAVAVLGHRYWMRQFHGDTAVVGRAIRVQGRPVTIVGVAPAGFNGTRTGSIPDIYLPMMFAPEIFDVPNWLANPRSNWIRLMARLQPGTTLAAAEADMTLVFKQFNRAFVLPLATTEAQRARAETGAIVLEPGGTGLFELGATLRTSLMILMALVGLVFLIACVNVANLVVGRAERQHRDTAIALALGASTGRIWSQNLAESVVLGTAGIAFGLVSATWIRDLLLPLVPASHELDVSMDVRVFALSVVLGVSTSLLLAAMTVWRARRAGVTRALKGEDVVGRSWLRKGLIVSQLALSVVVLVTASLFTRTLDRLQHVDAGVEREHVMMASFASGALPRIQQSAFVDAMLDELHRVPGVISAAFSNHAPIAITTSWNLQIDNAAKSAPALVENVTPDYFRTMGIPLLRGRDIVRADVTAELPGIVVNDTFATRFFAGDAVGRRVANGASAFEIVGVVRDSASDGLREISNPVIYLPGGGAVLVVRSALAPQTLAKTIEAAAHRLDPDVPVFNVRTMHEHIGRMLDRERTFANLSSAFGVIALLLSAVGLYAVIANAVDRRTRELGIRVALGASTRRIIRLVLKEAFALVAVGVLLGLPAAYATGRAIASSLFGVSAGDPGSLALTSVVMLLVASAAASIPAHRASKVDPLVALRAE